MKPLYAHDAVVACFCAKELGRAGDGRDDMMGDRSLPCLCHKPQRVYYEVTRSKRQSEEWFEAHGSTFAAFMKRLLDFWSGKRARKPDRVSGNPQTSPGPDSPPIGGSMLGGLDFGRIINREIQRKT